MWLDALHQKSATHSSLELQAENGFHLLKTFSFEEKLNGQGFIRHEQDVIFMSHCS